MRHIVPVSKSVKKTETGNFKMASIKYQNDILKKFNSCQATAGSQNTCSIGSTQSSISNTSVAQFNRHSTPKPSSSPPPPFSFLSALPETQDSLTASQPASQFNSCQATAGSQNTCSIGSTQSSISNTPVAQFKRYLTPKPSFLSALPETQDSLTDSQPASQLTNNFIPTNQSLFSPMQSSSTATRTNMEACKRCSDLLKENRQLRTGLLDIISKAQTFLTEKVFFQERAPSSVINNRQNILVSAVSETAKNNIHDVEIFKGTGVYCSQLTWVATNQKTSFGAYARSLLTALFSTEVLLESNLRGGGTKHGNENLGLKPLDQKVANAIISSTTQKFPSIQTSMVGSNLNQKMNELRAHAKKEVRVKSK